MSRQIDLESTSLPATLWQQIIRAQIKSEATTIRRLKRKGVLYLERLEKKVLIDDLFNHEGQADQYYWRDLFASRFKRLKKGAEDNIDRLLNFGYAVLRSTNARHLAAIGLNPGLGLGHQNTENLFNLANHFLGPYRYD